MPIVVQHAPSPFLVGAAAYQAGQGELAKEQQRFGLDVARFGEQQRQFDLGYGLDQERFGEQQRQFDVGMDFRGAQLAEDQRQANIRAALTAEQIAQQDYQFRRRMDQQYFLAQDARQSDLDRIQLGGQINQQLQRDRMSQEVMRDQLGFDQQSRIQGNQIEQQRLQMIQQQAMSEWDSLVKVLPQLDEGEQGRLIDQFNDKWSRQRLPMPVEFPQMEIPPDPREEALRVSMESQRAQMEMGQKQYEAAQQREEQRSREAQQKIQVAREAEQRTIDRENRLREEEQARRELETARTEKMERERERRKALFDEIGKARTLASKDYGGDGKINGMAPDEYARGLVESVYGTSGEVVEKVATPLGLMEKVIIQGVEYLRDPTTGKLYGKRQ